VTPNRRVRARVLSACIVIIMAEINDTLNLPCASAEKE